MMNYYKRHLGDYARDAGHLSLVEHGVYTLLLDRYYATERPITTDEARRVCRATDRKSRAAVDAVLAEFFLPTADGGWMNRRADQEIALHRDQAVLNRHIAVSRESKKRARFVNEACTAESIAPCADREPSHKPLAIGEQKHSVQRAAAQFARFWAAYPAKKGKAAALRAWRAKDCDARIDDILAHIQRMQAEDDGWRRGYIPHGSTYIAGERWHDVPSPTPRAIGVAASPSHNPGGTSPRRDETPAERVQTARQWARTMVELGSVTKEDAAAHVAAVELKYGAS
jgi:uncharacterized protein YdaU (DUF1376 family)